MEIIVSRIHFGSLLLGVLVWIFFLALIWLPRKRKTKSDMVESYVRWSRQNSIAKINYQEYINSGEAPGAPMTRVENTIVATSVAALVLYVALRIWGALV